MSSIRVASMATSWVALAQAIASAQTDMTTMSCPGSSLDSATTASAITPCMVTIQDRRCPTARDKRGMWTLSTRGAQSMLNAYTAKTRPKRPMPLRLNPSSCSQRVIIEPISTHGKPLTKPISRILAIRRSA